MVREVLPFAIPVCSSNYVWCGGHDMACSTADLSCCSGLTCAVSLAVFVMRASECLRTSFICLISSSRSSRVPEWVSECGWCVYTYGHVGEGRWVIVIVYIGSPWGVLSEATGICISLSQLPQNSGGSHWTEDCSWTPCQGNTSNHCLTSQNLLFILFSYPSQTCTHVRLWWKRTVKVLSERQSLSFC